MTTFATCTPEIISTPSINVNLFEITTSYERSDTKHVDLVVMRPDKGDQAQLLIGVIDMSIYMPTPLTADEIANAKWTVDTSTYEEEIRETFTEHVELSLAEARLLRNLLNRPDVQALLDA